MGSLANRPSLDELELARRIRSLSARFKNSRESAKILRASLRLGMEFFRARQGCIARVGSDGGGPQVVFATPRGSEWNMQRVWRNARGEKVRMDPGEMFARIRRRGRLWSLLTIRDPNASFQRDARRAFSSIGNAAGEVLAPRHIDLRTACGVQ